MVGWNPSYNWSYEEYRNAQTEGNFMTGFIWQVQKRYGCLS